MNEYSFIYLFTLFALFYFYFTICTSLAMEMYSLFHAQ